MADTYVVSNVGTGGAKFAVDQQDQGGGILVDHPYAKLEFGAAGTYTEVADVDGQRLPVTVGTSAIIGAVTETAPATDTASSGLNGRLQRIAQRLTSLIALLPTALTGSGNLKIAVVESTATQVVSGTVTANAGSNLNTSALALDATLTGRTTKVRQTDGTNDITALVDADTGAGTQFVLPISVRKAASGGSVEYGTSADPFRVDPTGTTTQPVSGTVTANAGTNLNTSALALDATVGTTNSEIGIVTETAPATDTASSGLNGRLQRIAQRLTSLIALLPAALVGGRLDINIGASGVAVPVTDNAGSLTVDAPVGTPVNVKIGDGSLTATVRDTGTSDSLNVAIVDAAGAQITTFGGGTEYTEDAVAATDPVGGVVMLTRRDTPATLVSANLDNVSQQGTNYGAAYCQIVTSAGAFVDSFGGSGGTAQADKSAFTEGTTTFTPTGGVFNETITADPTEDQAAATRITAKRALHVNLRNVAGAEVGISGAPVRVDPTGTTTQPVSGTVTANAGTGTFTVADASLDNATLVDNAAFTDGTTRVIMSGFIFDDTAGTALTENDAAAPRINANRASVSAIEDGATRARYATVTAANALKVDASGVAVPVTDNSGSLTVDQATATNLKAEVVGPTADNATNPTAKLAVLSGVANASAPTRTEGNVVPLRTNLAGDVAVTLDGEVPHVITDSGTITTVSTVTNLSQMSGVAISLNTGVRDTGTQRVTIATNDVVPASQSGTWTVQPGNTANTTAWIVGHGKTIKTVSGSLTADTDVIAAVSTKKLKVIAYSLISVGTNANTVLFKSNGTAGTEQWRVLLQSSTAIAAGANLATAAPSFLFSTVAGEKLTMDVNQTDTIHYSISYFDDDAT